MPAPASNGAQKEDPKSAYVTATATVDVTNHNGHADTKKRDSEELERASEGHSWRIHPSRNPLSYLFFFWVDPLISRGRKKRLEPEDTMRLDSLRTEALNDNFQAAWAAELATGKPDIRRAVIKGHWAIFLLTAVLYVIGQATTFAGPILLGHIVSGLACRRYTPKYNPTANVDDVCNPVSTLYLYSIGLFGAPFIAMLTDNHSTFLLNLLGTKMRNGLMAAIYRKCLRASNAVLQRESTGKIVTLMSNDAQKIQDVMLAIHACWCSPLYIFAIIALLYLEVKWSTFVGLFVMLLLGPVTGFVATRLARYRRSILAFVDRRISLVSEMIGGVRVIKFYAWENSFLDRIQEIRLEEVKILKKIAILSGAFGMLLFSGPVAVGLFSFMSFTLAGNTLTTAKAYAALAYFTMLRFPMSFLPMFIQQLVTANVALKRIQGFLLQPEAPDSEDPVDDLQRGSVVIKDADFAWELEDERKQRVEQEKEEAARMAELAKKRKGRGGPGGPPGAGGPPRGPPGARGPPGPPEAPKPKIVDDPTKPWAPTLRDINMDIKPGQLAMIAGSVGSGKSSLLSALIRNIAKARGTVQVAGSVAYVAQSSWIINDTLRENVVMGEPWDEARYEETLRVSQLAADLKILPMGDMTEIGERGITLSGGQKQRVSIARAVYSNADIYILDDPLSAVDSHVGRALFEQCIRGALKSKTVVLVTNALYYLPMADTIYWLEDGRITESGKYADMMAANGNFSALVSKNVVEEDEEDEAVDAQNTANIKKDGKSANSKKLANQDGPGTGPEGNRNLTGIEERDKGNVAWPVIKKYAVSAGGLWVAFVVVAFFACEQCLKVGTDLWVGVWTQDRAHRNLSFYIGIYFCWGVAYAIMTFIRSTTFMLCTLNASRNLHNELINHVISLPMSFFDTNPSGRVINRFSRDVEIMDSVLNASVIQFLGCLANLLCTFFLMCIAIPYFTIAFGPIIAIYVTIQRYYIPSARELQRIESITRSPIYALFGEAVNGVSTIRAYRKARHFTALSDARIEDNASAFITQKVAAAWLSMRLDVIGLISVTLAGLLCVNGNIDPGVAGLVLVYALEITKFLKFGTNMASKSESDFNSVERVVQYLKPEPEAAPETDKDVLATMPENWPHQGHIKVENLEMRYRDDTPLVLRGLTFEVQPGEKIGICGRTGSGKSSIFLVLFRMVEPSGGRVIIDGVDTAQLGLRHLRSNLSLIPQDPFMFSGTVRRNLDPFGQARDDALWSALDSVGLKPAIEALGDKLEASVVDGGANFSQGQRQLICLARALLRRSRILMMDEATASVDMDTDALIQATVRDKFDDCTVLTIAHRLNTIMDSDKVLVMDAGKASEFAEPMSLLDRPESLFTGLVNQTGRNNSVHLKKLASVSASIKRSRSKNVIIDDLLDTPSGSDTEDNAPMDREHTSGAPGGKTLPRAKSRFAS